MGTGESCQVDEERPESDSLLFFRPESATPVASVTLNTKVWALAYGREGARQGRRRCVFAMTEKKEIVKVVEGEVKETTEATEEEATVSAFDEVFDVDQVEKEAENLRKGRDYSGRGAAVRRRRPAEDEGLLRHAERTDPHAAPALGPLPVLLRQGGRQVVLLFSDCLFTLIVLMRERV